MGRVIPERMTAQIDGEFVVFLIGMRINKPWKVHKWLPVFLAMPKMLRELKAHPEIGFAMMKKALGELENMGHPDAEPKLNGKQINVMLTPLPVNKRKPKFHVPEAEPPESAQIPPDAE